MKAEQEKLSIKQCTNCVLPPSFPGISFNNKGVCNYCLDFKGTELQELKKDKYSHRFNALIREYKGQSNYDAIMCYSGGKDSTYTLALLKNKYHLHVVAVSFDNGFLPDQTFSNIHNVVEKLHVDHIMIKPRFDVLAKIFRYCADNNVYPLKALERSSAICTSCMAIMKYSVLRFALEKEIPFIVWGWSPGQAPISSSILKNIPSMIRKMQKNLYDPLFRIAGSEIVPYFLEDKHFGGSYRFPYNINPLGFLKYDEEAIYEEISRFGWKRPKEVDATSTNCLLNSYANYVHKKRLGFHPYAFELANLVREGYIDRNVALNRLSQPENPYILDIVKKKLR